MRIPKNKITAFQDDANSSSGLENNAGLSKTGELGPKSAVNAHANISGTNNLNQVDTANSLSNELKAHENVSAFAPREPTVITKFSKISAQRTHLKDAAQLKKLASVSIPVAKKTDRIAENLSNPKLAEGALHQEALQQEALALHLSKPESQNHLIKSFDLKHVDLKNLNFNQNTHHSSSILIERNHVTPTSKENASFPVSNRSLPALEPKAHNLEVLSFKVAARIIPENQMYSFHIASAANERTESGGKAQFSKLRTTAGPNARASYGVAQLTIREHLSQLIKLQSTELGQIGLTKSQVLQMVEHGKAAESIYRIMQGRKIDFFAKRIGLSSRHAKTLHTLVQSGQYEKIERFFGQFFSKITGLDASMLASMAKGMVLHNRKYKVAFRELYKAQFGEEFNKAHRVPRKMAVTALRMAEIYPELNQVLKLLGPAHLSASSLGHYLGVGDASENAHGWYALAAESVLGKEAYVQVIQQADVISSRMRQAYNVSHSISAVAQASNLNGMEKLKTIARLSRCFHGAPSRAKRFFFHNKDLSSPKFHSKESLLQALDEFISSRRREWSDQRLVRSFEHIIKQEGLS